MPSLTRSVSSLARAVPSLAGIMPKPSDIQPRGTRRPANLYCRKDGWTDGWTQRYRIFFRGKVWGVLTHSFLAIFVFFFFWVPGKKNKIFFPKNWTKSCFFFAPGKVYPSLTHSISEAGEKKTVPEKKNSIFTHSLEKPQKCANLKLFRGKKNTVPLTDVPFCKAEKSMVFRNILKTTKYFFLIICGSREVL